MANTSNDDSANSQNPNNKAYWASKANRERQLAENGKK